MTGHAQRQFAGMPEPLYAASPSRLLALLDCPRRYRMQYLDRPSPPKRAQRAHTSLGNAVHIALRNWWDAPPVGRTPAAGAALVRAAWLDEGFRDEAQSRTWREKAADEVAVYLDGVDPLHEPWGTERTVAFRTDGLAMTGRIDRLDEREGDIVVVDYKTSRRAPGADDARTSLPLALYAAAVWKMTRRPCLQVEMHHVPSGTVVAHRHTAESLERKVRQARSIAADAKVADAAYRAGDREEAFPPRLGPLCPWCDFRAHCPQGQGVGPEKSGWAALEEPSVPGAAEVD